MANVYAEKAQAQEAKNSLSQSRWDKVKSWTAWAVGGVFLGIGLVGALFTKMGNGCQAYADSLNDKSEQGKQEAQQIINDSKEKWKGEVRRKEVDNDSISITSSEDGEVVDLVA